MQSDSASAAGAASEEHEAGAHALVRRTAALARLAIDDEDVQRLAPQFARILAAFETLAQLDVGSAPAMTRAGSDEPRTRADEETPSLPVAAALANAPERSGDFYSVPRAIPSPRAEAP